MNEAEDKLYTFRQPVKDGYYYIVIEAASAEEAAQTVVDVVGKLKSLTGRLEPLSQFPLGVLVLNDEMQKRLSEIGYAYRFVSIQ